VIGKWSDDVSHISSSAPGDCSGSVMIVSGDDSGAGEGVRESESSDLEERLVVICSRTSVSSIAGDAPLPRLFGLTLPVVCLSQI
jgi:hypothetical protein